MDAQTPPIVDIWEDDLLDRGEDAVFLHNFLIGKMAERQSNGIPGSYVLNIDAEWGAGKTFFLNKFGKYLEEQDHLVVTIDAWRDDYVDDPFVAVLSAIDERLKPFIQSSENSFTRYMQVAKEHAAPVIFNTGKGIAKTLFKKFVGTNDIHDLIGTDEEGTVREITDSAIEAAGAQIDKLTDKFTDQIIAKFVQQEKASKSFRTNLGLALNALEETNGIKLPLFILIDELDRCRPTYAIALLERVKHLFDIDNVVFVFATNSEQLQHSITGAYGPSFDGYRYLKRFFDTTYKLENPTVYAFIKKYVAEANLSRFNAPGRENREVNVMSFMVDCASGYQLTLRDIIHVLDIIDIVAVNWPYETPIELLILFPLTVHFLKTGSVEFEAAVKDIPNSIKILEGYNNNRQPHLISIEYPFNLHLNASKSHVNYREFIDSESISISHNYVRDYLISEARLRSRNQRPYIYTLPSLIKRAGQMSEQTTPYE